MPSLSTLFTESDLKSIQVAVKEAEGKTSGEIVPYVVEESDSYEDALWRGGLLFVALALTIFVIMWQLSDTWMPIGVGGMALITVAAGALGALIVRYLSPVRRFLAGRTLMEKRVAQRAAEAFISEEVFNTRDRTGILIFLSVFERLAMVVGDSGINAKVGQSEWTDIVSRIIRGIRSGKPSAGLIDAIHQCGILLQKEGVKRRPDDTNELDDSLRMRDK